MVVKLLKAVANRSLKVNNQTVQELLQSGVNYTIKTSEKAYDVNKDLSKFLFNKDRAEYLKQVALGNIPKFKI